MIDNFFTIFVIAVLIFCLNILSLFVLISINLSIKSFLDEGNQNKNQNPDKKKRFNKGIHIHININHPNITNSMSNSFINAGAAVGVAAGGVGAGFVRCGDGSSQAIVNHKSDSINSGSSGTMYSSVDRDRNRNRSNSIYRARVRVRPRRRSRSIHTN